MAKKLTFTRRSLAGIADNKDAERELRQFHKLFKGGDIVPESIWVTANSMLAERAGALAFTSRLSYSECQKEVLHRHPHLLLGVMSYMRDREFPGITFVAEENENEDDT